ncbi:hypothetical protein D1007_20974 [Hordeum vulgare]|nr:hypothetical protein D1007_20974 [Hordeum vulgare]
MVYEDESSNDLSSLGISSSSDGMMYQIPASIDDEDYMGIKNSVLDVCLEHGLPPELRVAFEGFETGRSKSGRRDDNLENSLKIHHLKEEKRNLDANYDKLVEDVNQLLNAQEERVMDLSYMKVNGHGAESSSSAVSVMKSEIEKKEAEIMELKGKYSVLTNLAEAQGRVIRTQKANHLKEEEKLSEENYNLKVQVDKLAKSEDKLNDDILVINLHIDVKNAIQPEWFLGVGAADEPLGDYDEAPAANLGVGGDDDEAPAANLGVGADDDEAPAAILGVVKGLLTLALVVDLLVDLAGGGYDLASLLGLAGAGCDHVVGGCDVPLLAFGVPVAMEPTVAASYSGHS